MDGAGGEMGNRGAKTVKSGQDNPRIKREDQGLQASLGYVRACQSKSMNKPMVGGPDTDSVKKSVRTETGWGELEGTPGGGSTRVAQRPRGGLRCGSCRRLWSESNFLECSIRGGVADTQRSQVCPGEDAADTE